MTDDMTLGRKAKIWFAELRAPFFTAAIAPVLLGAAMAWHEADAFDLWLFLLTLIGAVLAHAGTNIINDYFDFKSGTDRTNLNRTVFNGGSPFLVNGLLKPREVYAGAMLCFGLCALIGIYLTLTVSYIVFVLGVIGLGFGYFYTSPKLNLASRGMGEMAIGAGFGPLIVAGTYLVQTGTFSWAAAAAGIPLGILIALVVFINQFPDMTADANAGKRHWVVRMGLDRSAVWYVVFMTAAFVSVFALWLAGIYPVLALWALLPAALSRKAVRIVLEKRRDVKNLVPAQALTIQVHLAVGILLTLGFVLATLD